MATGMAEGRRPIGCAPRLFVLCACFAMAAPVQAQQFASEWESDPPPASACCSEADNAWESGDWGDDCNGCQPSGSLCRCAGADERVWWFGADYLVWRIDGSALPPLVTDSPVGVSPVLGLPTTSIIAGNTVSGNSWRNGYRFRAGVWLDACHDLALAGDYFQLGDDDYNYFFAGDSGRNTGRPFFNTETGFQSVRAISGPGTFDGTVAINTDDNFQGAGFAFEQCVYARGDVSGCGPGTLLILSGGYRYFGYDSQLTISDSVTTLSGADAGMQSFKRDDFFASNEFHGGEFGAQVRIMQRGCWFEGLVKLAVGGARNSVTINGDTVTIPEGMVAETEQGGLLTSAETNIGHYTKSQARVIPTFRLGAGAYLTPNWTVRGGLTAIVWSGVARAAGQMPPNLAVDPRNIPPESAGGGASPLFAGIGGSELVACGVDLSVEFNY
jgi:Putative beta barrel porin-7 (BBP7)